MTWNRGFAVAWGLLAIACGVVVFDSFRLHIYWATALFFVAEVAATLKTFVMWNSKEL